MTEQVIERFFKAIESDGRIGSTHIAIFTALLRLSWQKGRKQSFAAYASEVMPLAKVSAPATYHRTVKQLDEYGLLKYRPSFKKNVASTFYLKD